MREKQSVTDRIVSWLRSQGHYVLKIHGEASQERGSPDLLACIHGRFCAIEAKQPGYDATPIQKYQLEGINRAGGYTIVAHSLQEVQDWLEAQEWTSS